MMRIKGRLVAFAFITALAAYGTLAATPPDLKPVRASIRRAAIPFGSAVAHAGTEPRVIKITASKFKFSPSQIILKKGQPVRLQLTSTDRTRGFLLRALDIDTGISPGKTAEVAVTPQVAGKFTAICDHYCGLGHGIMKMTVVVE